MGETKATIAIRSELKQQFPDQWIEEIIAIVSYQLGSMPIQSISNEDLLKLNVASRISKTLTQMLRTAYQRSRSFDPIPDESAIQPFAFEP